HNGTIVNGKPIKETTIAPGDSIEIGPLVFVIQIDNEPSVLKNPKQQGNAKKVSQNTENIPPKKETPPKENKQDIPPSKVEDENAISDDLLEGSSFLNLDELGDLSDLEELK
ncbi:MAG TPA: FHA domain-containing protein, partial [Sedimentisphaerales bacterium]|nr:FHA domain-containing protein [Sedimentisphaerales bacterium]